MWGLLRDWRRLICFFGVHLAVLACACGLVAAALLERLSDRAKNISASESTLARMLWVLGNKKDVERAREEAGRMVDTVLVPGETPNARETAMSLGLQEAFKNGNLALDSIAILLPREGRDASFAGVRIELTGLSGDLARTIATIERGWPFMMVHSALLKPEVIGDRGEKISATLDIYGATGWPGVENRDR